MTAISIVEVVSPDLIYLLGGAPFIEDEPEPLNREDNEGGGIVVSIE